jgi:hypothetical protein
MKDKKEYKYDAFISYRHCDLDKFVAENLHKILESYELPKNIKEQLGITGRTIRRVFRDQDELPLSSNLEDPIVDALNNTKYLIVICSPRLKDSMWCKKEIETFKELRGRRNIFCVLIEGEPSESFPEAVLTDDDGKTLVEPLAADVRGATKKEVLKKIKSEKLRLIAPMYNLDYDDLKQRHKMQEQKRKLTIATIAAGAFLLFALYSSIMLIKINSQQKILKNHQASSLSEKSISSLNNDSRYDAIKYAYESLTKFDGVKMPYTTDAEYALSEALGVYDVGSSFKAIDEIKTKGVVDFIKVSYENNYLATYDESEELTLWDAKTFKKIKTYSDISGFAFDEYKFSFIGEDYFSYINEEGNIVIVVTKNGDKIDEIKKENLSYQSVRGHFENKYLSYVDNKKLTIYNLLENKVIGSIEYKDDLLRQTFYSENGKYLFVTSIENQFSVDKEQYVTVHVIDTDNAKEINSIKFNAGYISNMFTNGNNVYMLFNRTMGAKFNLLAASYNYKDGNLNWTRTGDDIWGKFITRSYTEGVNDVAIVHGNKLDVLDADSGEVKYSFDMSDDILEVFSYTNKNMYLAINEDGTANYASMDTKQNVIYKGQYQFNLNNYSKVTKNATGYLLIPENENRVIYYTTNTSKDAKEVNKEYDYVKTDTIPELDANNIKEKMDIKNKNLVSGMFYSEDKSLLFVSYVDDSFAVYNVKEKKLLNTVEGVLRPDHYYGTDKYSRTYIGNITDAYILDKNYNKVGHIRGLTEVENDKVIITNEGTYYSLPIYTLNDLLKMAKDYLE